jgi:hypothetical protein
MMMMIIMTVNDRHTSFDLKASIVASLHGLVACNTIPPSTN